MAKKSLLSRLFSAWVKIVSFLFAAVFGVANRIVRGAIWLACTLFRWAKGTAQKQSLTHPKPKAGAAYAPFPVVKTVSGEWPAFEEQILQSKSSIGLIIGARGSGKSALGLRILENLAARGKKVCARGFSEETLPSWIIPISGTAQIPPRSVVLIDEGGILFSSRSSMSAANKLLSELLLVARHNDLSILFISQNSANLEINTIRQADYLLLRKSSLLQKDFERKKIRELYEEAEPHWNGLDGKDRLTYVYSDSFRGFVKNELPTFWTEKTGKAFSRPAPAAR